VSVASKRSILVVDDDENDQELAALVLREHGYKVTLAEDGVSALLQLGREKFDLILLDVNMPYLDGYKLIDLLHQKGIECPVIFISGYRTASQDEIRGFKLGAVDYIKKPFNEHLLLLRVKRIIGK
jgi:DNA-binding response OmpR family regulator